MQGIRSWAVEAGTTIRPDVLCLFVRLHEGVKESRRYFGSKFDSAGVICGGNNCGTQAVLASYRTILRSLVGLAVSLPFRTRLSIDCSSFLPGAIHTGE